MSLRIFMRAIGLLLVSVFILSGCGGGGGNSSSANVVATASVTGSAQKGPFATGSTVTIHQLADDGSRTGTSATGSIADDLGSFPAITLSWIGWSEVEVSGLYFDETTGQTSTAPMTLTALVNAADTTVFNINVNLITHLQAQRAKALVATEGSVDAANTAALAEVQQHFDLAGAVPSTLDMTMSGDANVNLLMASGALLATANSDPATLLDTLINDFTSDGDLNSPEAAEISDKAAERGFADDLVNNLQQLNGIDASNLPDPATIPSTPLISAINAITIPETTAAGTVIGTLDIDDGNSTLEAPIVGSALFTVDSDGKIKVATGASFDHETTNSYNFTVQVNNAVGSSNQVTVTVNITDEATELPVITNTTTTASIDENSAPGTEILNVTYTTDSPVSFELTGGDNLFAINQNGKISVADGAALDFESGTTSWDLDVKITNAIGMDTETFTVSLNDVADVAVSITNNTASFSINENAPADTEAAVVTHSYSDSVVSFSLSNTTLFDIDSSTGSITVAQGAVFDYETATSETFDVTVTNATNSDTQSFTINIDDVADTDVTITNNPKTFTVDENSPAGTAVGVVTHSSSDSAVSFSLENTTLFEIDNAGNITVAAGAVLDYETATSTTMDVVVSNDTSSDTQTFTVNLNNIGDVAPVISGLSTEIIQRTPPASVIGTIVVTKDEDSTITNRALTGTGATDFEINENDELIVLATPLVAGTYDLKAIYTSDLGDSNEVDISITVFNDFLGRNPAVMPLGDSITQGLYGQTSYRYPLKLKAVANVATDDVTFDFVGRYYTYNPDMPDDDTEHEGSGGSDLYKFVTANDDGIVPIEDAVAQNKPDIVLVHLGTNDFLTHKNVDNAIVYLNTVCASIREANPAAVIVISQIIPIAPGHPTLLDLYQDTPEENIAVATAANDMITQFNGKLLTDVVTPLNAASGYSPVILVDQQTGFNALTDTHDGIHPNATGDEKIGDVFYEALKPFFDGNPD